MNMFDRVARWAAQALNGGGDSTPAGPNRGQGKDLLRGAVDALAGAGRPAAPQADTPLHKRVPPLSPPSAMSTTPPPPVGPTSPPAAGHARTDRATVGRYEYLLRTAEPAQLEQIHADAFTQLTPAQREDLRRRLSDDRSPGGRPPSAEPQDLARAATRAEAFRPGTLSKVLARPDTAAAIATPRATGVAGGTLLLAIAGGAVMSALAAPLLADAFTAGVDFDALAGAVDVQGIADGVTEVTAGASDFASGASDLAAAAADHVLQAGSDLTGIGEPLSGFDLSGLGDLFGR